MVARFADRGAQRCNELWLRDTGDAAWSAVISVNVDAVFRL